MNRREQTLTTAAPELPSRPSRSSSATLTPERMALRIAELAQTLGVSRRTIERLRSAGRFPAPDFSIGKAPLWKPETIHQWIDAGGRV